MISGAALFPILFSVDALFAGAACGVRGITYPKAGGFLIGVGSALTFMFGGLFGSLFIFILPPVWGKGLGSGVLAGLGIWMIATTRKTVRGDPIDQVDRDRSGDLSPVELAFLAVGLGIDGFTGAAALALGGMDLSRLASLALMLSLVSAAAFYLGTQVVRVFRKSINPSRTRAAAGCLLVLLAILNAS